MAVVRVVGFAGKAGLPRWNLGCSIFLMLDTNTAYRAIVEFEIQSLTLTEACLTL
jgi:hypothetical protein